MSSPIETNVKFHVKFTSMRQARLVYKYVPNSNHSYTLLEFLHKWMPLHLLYTITILVCKKNPKDYPTYIVSD